jgi:hypothetical protein
MHANPARVTPPSMRDRQPAHMSAPAWNRFACEAALSVTLLSSQRMQKLNVCVAR